MSKKLAIFCIALAFAAPTLARAENLVDREAPSDDSGDAPRGSFMDLFNHFRGAPKQQQSANDPAAQTGCGPFINAAGDPVEVKKPGCP